MNRVEEKKVNKDGLNLHFIQSKKYKTLNIIAKFYAPLERETITKRALLPYILNQGTNNYPTKQELQLKLDDLYGAVLSVDGAKKGENHIISIRIEIANQKFIPVETSIIDEGIKLFSDLIYHPNVKNNAFEQTIFTREKETLKQKIASVRDDKMSYANMRLIDEMCAGEAYEIHAHGYSEDLDMITPETLYEYYQSMLADDLLDIYVLGDFNEADMQEKITRTMKRKNSNKRSLQKTVVKKTISKPKEVVEKENIQQAKLHLGYRTNIAYQDEDYFALQVFNGIFGGFPNSKLFINVREKNSLAYYASSRIESHKGLLFVVSGIAPDDFVKARDIIKEQMLAMKNGEITETELSETKEMIVNQLRETIDHPQGLIELLYQQVLGEKQRSPEEFITSIQQVTKEQVIQVATKIEEDTVYLLTSGGGTKNE